MDLIREYTFCHSKKKYSGIPIMAANMDTVGIFSVAKEMSKVGGQFFNSFIKLFLNKIWN